ncbi:hypothetical protein [Mangrovibacterium lignilyticum]|uniref:hypothetical protein n=1 Tax=Mangrovibacterium lignilyticum TaxID=2668052 RepID=UPI0013D378A1|nr:hypothetical protein [Mangrovibacterium lignilyticum]
MANLNEKEKRDFIIHVKKTIEDESAALIAAGFDPVDRISQLGTESDTSVDAEVAQQKAQAAALKATKVSNEALKVAYDDASSLVNLVEGLLGKDNELVHKLRQFRNN